jgi:2-amino-4-hydroxy-6-hydroxymethyldihydropteridine diphosphokinase
VPGVYVGIGSNIDREINIGSGLRCLKDLYGDLLISPLYESEAVGFAGPAFYNLVAAFDTQHLLPAVCDALLRIEHDHGRRRTAERFGNRTLDLDLLLYGDVVQSERPRLPRPEIQQYAFVLRPLADIAPAVRHPETGLSYEAMWRAFDEPAQDLRRIDLDIAALLEAPLIRRPS